MIRTVVTCNSNGCLALYLPDIDSGTPVLERAAAARGWHRFTATSHTCPACATGSGPVHERGACPACVGRTFDRGGDEVCQYCQNVTPHPADDWD